MKNNPRVCSPKIIIEQSSPLDSDLFFFFFLFLKLNLGVTSLSLKLFLIKLMGSSTASDSPMNKKTQRLQDQGTVRK